MSKDIVFLLRFNAMQFGKMCKPGARTNIDPEFLTQLCADWRFAADEIEVLRAELKRLRAELRTYTGDGHNTMGEPCTPNTPS